MAEHTRIGSVPLLHLNVVSFHGDELAKTYRFQPNRGNSGKMRVTCVDAAEASEFWNRNIIPGLRNFVKQVKKKAQSCYSSDSSSSECESWQRSSWPPSEKLFVTNANAPTTPDNSAFSWSRRMEPSRSPSPVRSR